MNEPEEKIIEVYNASKEDILNIKIPSYSRKVLVKTLWKNAEARTKSGIWVIGDTDWNEATHADRVGQVIALPKRLPFKPRADLMPWETQIEVVPGMMTYYDYLEGLNCVRYIDEDGDEYKLLNYDDLYLATMPKVDGLMYQETEDGKSSVIPLNGYYLFEDVYHDTHRFSIDGDEKVDHRYGIVAYTAHNNTSYENGSSVDAIELLVGDKVRFNNIPAVYLEDGLHCHFDGGKMYRRAQARNVDFVWRGNNEIILPQGKVLISQIPDEMVTPQGIILPKAQVKNHTGRVVVSSNIQIPIETEILYIKGAGMKIKHNGDECRILRENEILYIKE